MLNKILIGLLYILVFALFYGLTTWLIDYFWYGELGAIKYYLKQSMLIGAPVGLIFFIVMPTLNKKTKSQD